MGRNYKFTQKEFIERHIEFLKNYSTKYKFQDLDFRMVMLMSGCSEDEFQEHMMGLSKLHNITLTGSHSSEVSFNNTIDGLTSVIHNLRSSSKKYFDFLNSIEKKLASNLKKTIISEDHLLDSGVDENLKDVCNKIFNKFLNNEIHDYREIANHEHKFISDLNSLVHHLENLEIYCIDPSISEDSITLCDKNKSSLAKLIAPKIKMLKRKIVQLGHMELPRKL